jgi:hypothetical protein
MNGWRKKAHGSVSASAAAMARKLIGVAAKMKYG